MHGQEWSKWEYGETEHVEHKHPFHYIHQIKKKNINEQLQENNIFIDCENQKYVNKSLPKGIGFNDHRDNEALVVIGGWEWSSQRVKTSKPIIAGSIIRVSYK